MNYWLFKSEPFAYGIDQLERDGRTAWSGVRNFQARNHMKAMCLGDLGFFYHSSTKVPAIVGIVRVCAESYPDPTQFDAASEYFDPSSRPERPKWKMVDVEFVERWATPVTLPQIRANPALADMVLVQRGRLSVQPVTVTQWELVQAMRPAGLL